MKFKKRIHIAPVGFEVDRIVKPAVEYKADKVYLLVHDNKKEDKATPYIENVIKELGENKIQSENYWRVRALRVWQQMGLRLRAS